MTDKLKIKKPIKEEQKNEDKLKQVLSVSLRPRALDEIIGLDDIVSSLKVQFKSGRVPHFFLITGNTGCGKTTISRIIAKELMGVVHEINAADKNGIDDIREFLENVNYMPISPYKTRVYIFDEFHQMTTAAQNCLLKICEEPPSHVFIICCTNNDSKILVTLKRRAYTINVHGIDKDAVSKLINFAKEKIHFKGETKEIEEAFIENEICSPGIILQGLEKFFNGSSVTECIYGTSESNIDTRKICLLLSKGDFKTMSSILKTINKTDISYIRSCILGYFKTILLNSSSVAVAKAIQIISQEHYDLPIFLSDLCIAADLLKNKST